MKDELEIFTDEQVARRKESIRDEAEAIYGRVDSYFRYGVVEAVEQYKKLYGTGELHDFYNTILDAISLDPALDKKQKRAAWQWILMIFDLEQWLWRFRPASYDPCSSWDEAIEWLAWYAQGEANPEFFAANGYELSA